MKASISDCSRFYLGLDRFFYFGGGKICARTHFYLLGPLASIDTFTCRSTQPQISLTKRLLNHAVMFSVQEADGLEIMMNIHIDPCFPKAFSKCALVPFGKTLLIVY